MYGISEAIQTVLSCVGVATILLVATIVLMTARLCRRRSIILVRLGGTTFGLAGLYISFSVAITGYIASDMNSARTLGEF